MRYRIVEFTFDTGRCPFRDWMDALDGNLSYRIQARISRFEHGHFGDFKKLAGTKIFEARFDFGPGYRVYFGILHSSRIILLLAGGDKSEQRRDIARAEEMWDLFLEVINAQNS